MTLWKCWSQYASNFGKLSSGHRTQKVDFHSNLKDRQCQRIFKLQHNWTHLTCCKVMLKILQARLQQYVNCELPNVLAGFWKDSGTRDQIANIRWIIKKANGLQRKISTFALLAMPKPVTVFSSVQFRHSVVSDSLWPHELQHTRPPCPSPAPGVH